MKQLLAGWQRRISSFFGADDGRIRQRLRARVEAALAVLGASPDRLEACLKADEERRSLVAEWLALPPEDLAGKLVGADGSPLPKITEACVLVHSQPFLAEILAKLTPGDHRLVDEVWQDGELPAPTDWDAMPKALAVDFAFFPSHDDSVLGRLDRKLVTLSTRAALLARHKRAALVPVWAEITPERRLRLVPGAAIPSKPAEDAAQVLPRFFHARMKSAPEHIDWTHSCFHPPTSGLLFSRRPFADPNGERAADAIPFRALLHSPDSIREAALALPAIRALRRGRPDMRLTIVAGTEVEDLWRTIGEADDMVAASGDIGEQSRDLGIVLEPSPEHVATLRKFPCRRVVGMDHLATADLLDETLPSPEKLGPPEHRQRSYLRVAHRLGAEVRRDPALFLPVGGANLPASQRTFALAPASEDGPTHAWDRESYLGVIRAMADSSAAWRIFLPKGSPEAAFWENKAREWERTSVDSSSNMAETLRSLGECALLLANDNSFLHLGALLGMTTVGIFGPSDPVTFAPRHARAVTVHHHVECSPCHLAQCPLDHRCMKAVTVDEVVASLRALMRLQGLE